ncbi:MAG: hypothetical protein WD469_06960 [Paenibacillaceae bacterium]
MNISELITQQQFKEILINACQKGQESEYMEARDLIKKIKEDIMNVISSANR